MPKKILVVERSSTIQNLFSQSLSKEYSLFFVEDALRAFDKLIEEKIEAVFANAELQGIDGFEFIRILKKTKSTSDIPMAIYSTNKISFEEYFSKQAEVKFFSHIDSEKIKSIADNFFSLDFENLNSESESEDDLENEERGEPQKLKNTEFEKIELKDLLFSASEIWRSDNHSNAVLSSLFSLVSKRDSISEIAKGFLSLVAETCASPLAALYVIEADGPHSYYVSAAGIKQQEVSDFFKVCDADFENARPEFNAAKIEKEHLKSDCDLSLFLAEEVAFSSYKSRQISFSDGKIYATVHISKTGNLTSLQKKTFYFCTKTFGIALENALLLKSKTFFERRIRKAFSRFVPAEIIDDLAKKDMKKDVAVGETRQIAILFSDIRSFTNISEKNRPEVLVAFLNRYFTVMVDIIKKHGGTIDKFIGDAIMAEFGTPISYEDNARRAAMAAYEMRKALPDVPLGDLVMPEGMTFNTGIGIHYGDAIVGSIGSKDKTDYSVIGDSVNLASRLEGLTKTYGVQLIVSESMKTDIVAKGNPDGFVFRHLDNVRVKGKKNAVPIYAIDRSIDEFPAEYRDSYKKGMDLYKQGVFRLAKDYFEKSLRAVDGDKAAKLMLSRCEDFIANPPENWDGAISFTTK